MKSRQVGYVLMALIAVGIAGLLFRVIAGDSDEIVLEGIVEVSQFSSDRILVEGNGLQTEIQRLGEPEEQKWFVDDQLVFEPLLQAFWQAVTDLNDAQLVSTNPDNHPRMGVVQGDAIEVSFFQDRRSLQEKFIVGTWKPDVRLCYVRRAGHDETYGIPCPGGNIFNPDPNQWKNPVVASVPPSEIRELQFTYPDEQFAIRTNDDGEWVVLDMEGNEKPVNPMALQSIMASLQVVIASGFASDEEAEELNFTLPDVDLRIITHEEASTPTTRLRFLLRDDGHFYVRQPTTRTVYIMDGQRAAQMLFRLSQVVDETAEN